jgi:heavy metal sensor kinase
VNAWWNRGSLRFRLALWYGIAGTVLLALFSAVIYGFVARKMGQPLDQPLRQDLEVIRRHLTVQGNVPRWDGKPYTKEKGWAWERPWFELWDDQGNLVQRFWPLEESRVEQMPEAPPRGRETLSVFAVASDLKLRVLTVPFPGPTPEAPPWTIRVMRIHQRMNDPLRSLLAIIALALPCVIALLVIGGYAVTRIWLRPLGKMVRQAERISADDLAQRLPGSGAGDEIGRLATVFNRTLDRLEDSFQTLDRFVADASHELRTPLTTLRNVGEVALRKSRTEEEYREIVGSMLEEAERLHRLIERLLELASVEGGAQSAQPERVQVDSFVGLCLNDVAILAEQKNQQITLEAEQCEVSADPVLLRQAFQNLIDNALKYSGVGTTIRVAVAAGPGECRVAVTDEGPGIPAEHRTRLAERFFRVDDARGRGRGGFGLGLAITKAYMNLLGGRLEFESVAPHGSRFTLVLPGTTRG